MKLNAKYHRTRTGLIKHNPIKRRYKVITKPDKEMGKYDGMNYKAAKELGFSPVPKKDEVYVSDSTKGLYRKQVVAHEKIEQWHMENRGLKYKNAHAIAEEFDKNIRR
jgi:hypothetical protein